MRLSLGHCMWRSASTGQPLSPCPIPLLLFLTAAAIYQQTLALGEGKVCVLVHIWDGCKTQHMFVCTSDISTKPGSHKTEKQTRQKHLSHGRGVAEVAGLPAVFPVSVYTRECSGYQSKGQTMLWFLFSCFSPS